MKDLYNLRVASVQDEFRVVINAGTEDGVREDMEFVIFSKGEEIKDPETGASLGQLEAVKGRIEIVHAQPTMAIGRSAQYSEKKYPVSSGLLGGFSVGAGGERQYDVRQVRLQLKDVVVGDFVRRIS